MFSQKLLTRRGVGFGIKPSANEKVQPCPARCSAAARVAGDAVGLGTARAPQPDLCTCEKSKAIVNGERAWLNIAAVSCLREKNCSGSSVEVVGQ